MGKTLREKAILAILGVIALYAFAGILWFVSAESSWKKAAKAYDKAKRTYEAEVKLIGEKRKWVDAYENEKATMPTFESGKATDTTWRRKLDEIAARHNIVIASAQTGAEVEAGDVLELPIEVRSWEGSLEALVRFMHELENTNDGMFDITQLNFKPSSKRGYLRGSFTLNCAYMRE
ncbi:MAG: hypothetical protein IKC14_03955 [Kiritimatiellae bacterium]|jgi:hypothetical protein|nr:hypothetical protein [Kiritimatiellia bacterium]